MLKNSDQFYDMKRNILVLSSKQFCQIWQIREVDFNLPAFGGVNYLMKYTYILAMVSHLK